MIGATRRWFQRNRKGLAIGAGVIGAGYMAGQYLISKISEARERMSSDRIARENLRRRFEQNQTDCTYTVLALLPTATENIIEALPVEDLTKELQQKRAERLARLNTGEATGSDFSSVSPSLADDASFQSEGFVHTSQVVDAEGQPRPKRNKTQLWNEVKITSITRSFTLIYTLSLLTIFTRIQLNLLGRRNYLSSVISLATPPANASTISLEDHDDELTQTLGDDFETNRRYLAFSWWLLHRGWKELVERVQTAVEEVFGPLNPREDISLAKLSELTLEIRKKVEGRTEDERRSQKWLSCLLPPAEEEEYVLRESGVEGVADPSSSQTALKLRHLLDETADLIDSPSFSYVLTLLNNEGFSTLVDQRCAADAFKAPTSTPETAPQSFDSIATVIPLAANAERKTKLANLLAVMARQAHIIGNGTHSPNEYLVAMDQNVRELEAFSAVVYSSNFDLELLGAKEQAATARETDFTDASPASPSVSHVMVEREVDVELNLNDAEPAKPSIVEHVESSIIEPIESSRDEPIEPSVIEHVETSIVDPVESPPEPVASSAAEPEAPASVEVLADSTFEQAWGKAVDDTKDAPVEDHPAEQTQPQ
ncbi:unnamed protein product [Penicillium salamii]|uniref:Peroxin-3 n=1 Tax=Penicillium salamii TaxID=1612424 RepID=A0A9W4JKS3_9EURO|nr:unnamed protein product [Penicillium salamii]CAG8335710.1 unnamed protein product [Penicillium salamii]CAG8339066.1 unnamed protein product [Penicillium salamii]CAG8387756.1 unnamed protein product [Penicillium salamii]CAG8395553.1 unnamed protein product [Penicillium salamii]